MDTSGRNLQELCRSANSDAKVREDLVHDSDTTLNICEQTDLNRLLASHMSTKEIIGKFLDQENSRYLVKTQQAAKKTFHPEVNPSSFEKINALSLSLHQQDSKGITALHIAVYRNSVHVEKIVRLLLDCNSSSDCSHTSSIDASNKCSLASIQMKCGSCPLHIVTGQNLTIKEDLLKTLLSADSSVVLKEDANGDNPLSLLWKNTLRFRWAISVMNGVEFIDYIKKDDRSWMAIITPHQFIKFSLLMIRAALRKDNDNDNDNDNDTNENTIITMHDLCMIPRCPPMLLRLLQSPNYNEMFGVSGNAYTFDKNGMLPIHYAVQNPPVTYKFVPSLMKSNDEKSLVDMLLGDYPSSVRVTCDQGRLPLHYALDSGCLNENDILSLVKLYPDSLRIHDPLTGLFPFMLVAANRRKTVMTDRPEFLPKLVERMSDEICTASDQKGVTEKCQAEWKNDHVRMTCRLLMLYPDVTPFPITSTVMKNKIFGN